MNLSGELARSLLEAAPDATVIVDGDGTIVFANTQVREIFGFEPAELVGTSVERLMPPRFRDVHAVHRDTYGTKPKLRPMGTGLALYGLHKNGTEFPVEISLSPVKTASGTVLVVAAIRDATRQKNTEHQLIEANRAKSRLLAAASHDLRQPLQTLQLLNRVARREAAGNPRLEMIIDRQQQALDSMSGLLASVLDIGKLDSGVVVERKACAVDEILERLASDFEPQAIEKGLSIDYESCGEACRADPGLLRRLLGNLVSNAIRYTERGEVRLKCSARGDELDIEVSDTGVGIAADQLERIFDEFYQIDRGSRRPEGLGLGLSIVRRLAELMQLDVGVRSTPGEGTTFTVTVPRCAPPASEHDDGRTAAPATSGSILVIDDEPAVAEAMSLMLELEGFDVRIASCEQEALEQVGERAPDLLISDYHLRGGETGLGVVTALRRALDADIPAVFVTGDTARTALDAAELSHIRVLTKPLRAEELLETINTELAIARAPRPAAASS